MKFVASALCLCLLIASGHAFLESIFGKSAEWNNLRVGFSLNPFNAFYGVPRTVAEAINEGWTKDTSVGGCDIAGTAFNGNRYRYKDEQAVMVLYDKNGYVAGIQAGIPKTLSTYPGPNNAKYHVFNEEKDMWVVTAYFTEPASICTSGRTEAQYNEQGTGTMLGFQIGNDTSNLFKVPMDESKVTSTTKFVDGRCFYGMGMHYWYNGSSKADMSCDETFPVFLLYNQKRLNAFGWAFNPNYNNSKKWEHPSKSVFGQFMIKPPTCLGKDGPTSTLHIYMTDKPVLNLC